MNRKTELKREILELKNKIQESNDFEEVKSLTMDLEKRNLDLEELENSEFNPKQVIQTSANKKETLELRSDETFSQRMGISKELSLGRYLRGIFTNDWHDALEERSEAIQVNAGLTTADTGAIIPTALSAEIITNAIQENSFIRSGVTVYPMTSNTLDVAVVTKDPKMYFKAEGEEQTEPDAMEIGKVTLTAKTLYGVTYVSLEAMKSAKNLETILIDALTRAYNNALNSAVLYGVSGPGSDDAPEGILNNANVNQIEATSGGSYDELIKAVYAIKKNNSGSTPLSMVYGAGTGEYLALLKDGDGKYLEKPKALDAVTAYEDNAVNDGEAIIYDPKSIIYGIQNELSINVSNTSDYCLKNGMYAIQVYGMMDCKVVRPEFVSHVTAIGGTKVE